VEAPVAEETPTPPAPVAPSRGEAPARVAIPALGLDEELIDLGIGDDGSLEVPEDFSRVGWFTGGGRPGGIGPTVIAGHVDSAVGPAVFFELSTLLVGDRFTIVDVAGTSFEYEVYRAEDFAKNAFPTAEVFGAVLGDEVRLITCTGLFDSSIGHYDDNRVVFAARVTAPME
jgi:sortase (surface protein transpeptidase)